MEEFLWSSEYNESKRFLFLQGTCLPLCCPGRKMLNSLSFPLLRCPRNAAAHQALGQADSGEGRVRAVGQGLVQCVGVIRVL